MKRRAIALIILLAVRGAPLFAQEGPDFSLGATIAGIEHVTHESGTRSTLQGMAAGGEAMARFGLVALSASYLQGTLHPKSGDGDVGFVGGSASASVRLTPWFEVGSVVQVHRVDEVQPERWLFWGARAAADLPIVGNTLRGRGSYAQGVHGSVNLPINGVRSQSGEVGLTLALPGRPFVVDLATSVEGNRAGSRSRTLQQLAVTVAWRGF